MIVVPDPATETDPVADGAVAEVGVATMTREEIRDAMQAALVAEGNPSVLSSVIADIYATLAVSDLPATTTALRDIMGQLGQFFGDSGPGKMFGKLLGKGSKSA